MDVLYFGIVTSNLDEDTYHSVSFGGRNEKVAGGGTTSQDAKAVACSLEGRTMLKGAPL